MAEPEEKQISTDKRDSVVKHTIKDSVFTNLFKEKKYLVQLYHALHPERKGVTEEDIPLFINSAVCEIYAGSALPLFFEATERIAEQNLDFEDVLNSFSDMKNNLKSSLEKQWSEEQLKREQIAALAHGLKTPLTVIQGNIDLINEIELDGEQRLYVGYITESSGQMGVYIRTLIDISRTVAGYQLNLEEIDIAGYMEQIENIELNTELIKEIKKIADTVPDYCYPLYTKHLFVDIIIIVFFAVLAWGMIFLQQQLKLQWKQ